MYWSKEYNIIYIYIHILYIYIHNVVDQEYKVAFNLNTPIKNKDLKTVLKYST